MTNQTSSLQLSNAQWPKFHRDLKNTGQSPYTSDADGTIKWYINFPDGIRGTPAIDIDGTIYIGMYSAFYAINPDGTEKWSYPIAGNEYSSPIISQYGIIYNVSVYGDLYAFNRDGTLAWLFSTGISSESGPAIGLDGNIYIGGNGYNDPWPGIFIAINPNGSEAWRYTTNDHGTPETLVGGSAANFSPAISPTDGTIYVKIREDPYNYLVAFAPNGVEKWRVTIGNTDWWSRAVCPAIGSDGTIYIPGSDGISVYLYAITDNGNSATVKWQYTLCTGDIVYAEDVPAIATDGTIYIAATYNIGGTYYYNKYAITDNGDSATLKWSFPSNTEIRSPAMIGLDGTIYFGSNGDGSLARFYALNPNDGSIKWYKDLAVDNSIVCSPSMASDGTIYVGTDGIYGDPSGQSLVAFGSTGTFDISSTPSGASISIDGVPQEATTPAVINMAATTHKVLLTLPGYLDRTITFGITIGVTTYINTTLTPVTELLSYAPWPKFHHDVKNTGQSPYISYTDGALKLSFLTENSISSSPAIGPDGVIYVGSNDYNLYAINPDRTLKWSFLTDDGIHSSPVIGSDGVIYVGSNDENLYAINPDGTLKWSFPTNNSIESSPTIGSDGTIYIGSTDNNLYAINPEDGTEEWHFPTGNSIRSSPAIGSDGIIYVGSNDDNLYAINPDGTLKWFYVTGRVEFSSPSIQSNEVIYIGAMHFLFAINYNGTEQWRFPEDGYNLFFTSPAIGSDGVIYVGSRDGNLYAINPDGTFKWNYLTGGSISSSPAVGSDGVIYVGSDDGNIYAINPDSTLKWNFLTGDVVASSPAIGADGVIYVGSEDGNLYAFGSTGTPAPPIGCPTSPKYSGDTVTLDTTPNNGIGPYYVEFRKNGIIIPSSRLQGQSNPIIDTPENTLITRIYTLDDLDISSASTGTIDFSVYIEDSCPTGTKTCNEICTINIGCLAPVCNFTVT